MPRLILCRASVMCASTVGCAVPLDKELCADDLKDFIEAAECDAVCCADKYIDELIPILSDEMLSISFGEIMDMSVQRGYDDHAEVDNIDIPRDRMQILIFTSGTTGNSKGVCLSQYNICSNIYSTVSSVKIKPKDITLSILPLHHTYECTLNCMNAAVMMLAAEVSPSGLLPAASFEKYEMPAKKTLSDAAMPG